jgi:MFS family permease
MKGAVAPADHPIGMMHAQARCALISRGASEPEVRMAIEREAKVVYAAGLVQGIVLVTFPAASTIFTDPGEYDLSNTQYGTMFLPQVITAITASLLGGSLARRFGTKQVYLAGLGANLLSMVLLILSTFFTSDQPAAAAGCRVRRRLSVRTSLRGGLRL